MPLLAHGNVPVQVATAPVIQHVLQEAWDHEFDASETFYSLDAVDDHSESSVIAGTSPPNAGYEYSATCMPNTRSIGVLSSHRSCLWDDEGVLRLSACHCEPWLYIPKKTTDAMVANLPTVALWVLWMLLIMTVDTMFAQLIVNVPRVTDCELMVGNDIHGEIKVHIDSGAFRHFILDARPFAPWDDGVPNITFNTASGVAHHFEDGWHPQALDQRCLSRRASCHPIACLLCC